MPDFKFLYTHGILSYRPISSSNEAPDCHKMIIVQNPGMFVSWLCVLIINFKILPARKHAGYPSR